VPIYEYLCPTCNRVYSFLARSASAAQRQPSCPRCGGQDLRKQFSNFAFVRGRDGRTADPEAGSGSELDDQRTERAMMKLMRDAESMDENDPRQLGRLMRRMADLSGEGLDPEMEEAVRRLEAGEDPERIEDDLGDALDGAAGMGRGSSGAPSRDEGLYEL
jgi:putative FmdB family regulatory protein